MSTVALQPQLRADLNLEIEVSCRVSVIEKGQELDYGAKNDLTCSYRKTPPQRFPDGR